MLLPSTRLALFFAAGVGLWVVAAWADTTSGSGFRIFGEDENQPFERATANGQWLLLLTHSKHCGGGVCDRAERVVLKTMELFQQSGESFNLTRIDCYEFIEPCLDYGAKKRYPFLAVNYHGLLKKGVQYKDEASTLPDHQSVASALDFKAHVFLLVRRRFIDRHVDRDVVRLDEANFDSSVASGHWMVQFYAPFETSKHSRDAWNVWTNLAAVALRTKEFNVARVMCSPSFNLDLCARFLKLEVSDPDALPLIYWIEGGVEVPYDGLWGVPNMVAWWKTSAAERERVGAQTVLPSGEGIADQTDQVPTADVAAAAEEETRDEL